jgi:rubrerythrin
MTNDERNEQIKKLIAEYTQTHSASAEAAKSALVAEGILDNQGNLKPEFGGNPICQKCQISMQPGIGINPTRSDEAKWAFGLPDGWITHENLRLDNVWKCPNCGHSADMKKSKT